MINELRLQFVLYLPGFVCGVVQVYAMCCIGIPWFPGSTSGETWWEFYVSAMLVELTFRCSVGAWPLWNGGCIFGCYFCVFCDHGLVSLAFFTSFWASLGSFYFLRQFLFLPSFQIYWNKFVNIVRSATMFALKTWIQHNWFCREQCEPSVWFHTALFPPLYDQL